MKKNIEVIFDTTPNEGCGCNCGCAGSSIVEDVNDLVENLKKHNFSADLDIALLPISDLESVALINKINAILDNTNASFRVDETNKDEILSEILPIITLDGAILSAYGVPKLNEVILGIQNNL